jgi:hypothetical protein
MQDRRPYPFIELEPSAGRRLRAKAGHPACKSIRRTRDSFHSQATEGTPALELGSIGSQHNTAQERGSLSEFERAGSDMSADSPPCPSVGSVQARLDSQRIEIAYPAGKAKARGLTATSLRGRRSRRESQVAAAVGSGRSDTVSGPLNQGAALKSLPPAA